MFGLVMIQGFAALLRLVFAEDSFDAFAFGWCFEWLFLQNTHANSECQKHPWYIHRQTDRQTDKRTDGRIYTHIHTHTHAQTDTHTSTHIQQTETDTHQTHHAHHKHRGRSSITTRIHYLGSSLVLTPQLNH